MIDFLCNTVPLWWYVVMGIWVLLLGREMGYFFAFYFGLLFTLCGLMLWGMWYISLGLFFESPLDMPWWLWLILLCGGIGPAAGAATTIIHHSSNERVSSVTITKK